MRERAARPRYAPLVLLKAGAPLAPPVFVVMGSAGTSFDVLPTACCMAYPGASSALGHAVSHAEMPHSSVEAMAAD